MIYTKEFIHKKIYNFFRGGIKVLGFSKQKKFYTESEFKTVDELKDYLQTHGFIVRNSSDSLVIRVFVGKEYLYD